MIECDQLKTLVPLHFLSTDLKAAVNTQFLLQKVAIDQHANLVGKVNTLEIQPASEYIDRSLWIATNLKINNLWKSIGDLEHCAVLAIISETYSDRSTNPKQESLAFVGRWLEP